jgi:hypothetical protein
MIMLHYVGENYRQLSDNEIVEPGDEAWYPEKDKWVSLGQMDAEITATILCVVSPFTAIRRPARTEIQIPVYDSSDWDSDE